MLVLGCPGRKKDSLFPRTFFYLIIQNWFSPETLSIQTCKAFFAKTSFLLGSLWVSQVKKCGLWVLIQPVIFEIVEMTGLHSLLYLTTWKNTETKTYSTGISERMEPNESQNTRPASSAMERNQNEFAPSFRKDASTILQINWTIGNICQVYKPKMYKHTYC